MTAPDIRAALAALLRATDPGEHALPEAERLGAVRPGAIRACNQAFAQKPNSDAERAKLSKDRELLTQLLMATSTLPQDHRRLAAARVAAQAALALPAPPPCDRFITAREFHGHQAQTAGGAS